MAKTNKLSDKEKACIDLAYSAGMEKCRLELIIKKLKATVNLLEAQAKYYDELASIEDANELFNFDLDLDIF